MLQLRYYLVVLAVFVAPDATQQILPVDSKAAVFSWMAGITALLGSIGFGLIYNNPKEKNKRQKRREARTKKRAERKKQRKNKKFFKALKKDCCQDACDKCFAMLMLFIYAVVVGLLAIGTIVGLIGFFLSLPWGTVLLIVSFSIALLIGVLLILSFLSSYGNSRSTPERELMVMINFILAAFLLLATISVIIVGAIFLAALFNPTILALVIIAALLCLVVILGLILYGTA